MSTPRKTKASKEIVGNIKLIIPAGSATPSPPIGPALAPKKVSIPEFCKQFNAESLKSANKGDPIPVNITVYKDGSFTFVLRNPPVFYLIKKECGLDKGLATPGRVSGPSVNRSQLRKVARIKMHEMRLGGKTPDEALEAALRCVEGVARSAGLTVVNDENIG